MWDDEKYEKEYEWHLRSSEYDIPIEHYLKLIDEKIRIYSRWDPFWKDIKKRRKALNEDSHYDVIELFNRIENYLSL